MTPPRGWRGAVLAGALVLGWLGLPAWTPPIEARPGGGQSYSGGSRSSGSSGSRSSGSRSGGSSSSSSGGGPVTYNFDDPVVNWVAFGFVGFIVLAFVAFGIGASRQAREYVNAVDWDSVQRRPPRPKTLADLRTRDPEFSTVLFDDFVYALFAAAHQARASVEDLGRLAPYLLAPAREALAARAGRGPVEAAVVGAVRVQRLFVPDSRSPGQYTRVELEFEANVTTGGEKPATEYVRERWMVTRAAEVQTRPWTGARTFGCPACGAPFQSAGDRKCASCGQVADNGRLDWRVERIAVLSEEPRPPALTGTMEEAGTQLPTVYDPDLAATWAELAAEDAALVERTALEPRLQLIFGTLQTAWAAQDLRGVRPFVSDGMLGYLQYWVDAYRNQGLQNRVDGARITTWHVARLRRDKHYDAVTVRLFGTGCDHTVETASGRVVAGNARRERPYSEYWTLIRGRQVRGAPRVDRKCPSCAAELRINRAGSCEFCGSHVTAGEFDWVLSRIEQDDSYTG